VRLRRRTTTLGATLARTLSAVEGFLHALLNEMLRVSERCIRDVFDLVVA